MKVVIAGGREIIDPALVEKAVAESGFEISEVICGDARGVDTLGRLWAEARGIPVRRMPAEWSKHGNRAGPLRNAAMAAVADALVLVWDGSSRGSMSMKMEAAKKGLRKFEFLVNEQYPEGRMV